MPMSAKLAVEPLMKKYMTSDFTPDMRKQIQEGLEELVNAILNEIRLRAQINVAGTIANGGGPVTGMIPPGSIS